MATRNQEAIFIHKLSIRTGEIWKRIFDVVISSAGLLFLSPIFAVVAAYIKQTSPGPVFYRGPRVGRRGKLFYILKFRTMSENKESYEGPRITAKDDKRITQSGRWLRNTKLNELPQLWNVLKGEMSLVGPRPEDPVVASTWPVNVREEILSIRPGITSPASVFYRDEENNLKADSVMEKYLNVIGPSKFRLDQIYVRDHTLVGDLDILFLTAIFLLPNLREQPIPESLLTWGPIARLFSRHINWFFYDVSVAFLAVAISSFLWRLSGPLNLGLGLAALYAVGIALMFGTINAVLGTNRIAWSQARPLDAWALVFSDAIVTGILISVQVIRPGNYDIPIGLLVLTSILALFGFIVSRYHLRLITGLAMRWFQLRGDATHLGEKVLIIGAGEMAQLVVRMLHQNNFEKAFTIIGTVDDDPKKQGLNINGYKVLGTIQDLPRLIRDKNIGAILFSIGRIQHERRQDILKICHQTGVRLVLIPNLLELLSACLFAPKELSNKDVISKEWDGAVPVQVIIGWLTELEALAEPENKELIFRLNSLRDALAADIMGKLQ
jgi:lipopolysaccharide/colanic/teichoic acid biosynthesis glycosyltransferase